MQLPSVPVGELKTTSDNPDNLGWRNLPATRPAPPESEQLLLSAPRSGNLHERQPGLYQPTSVAQDLEEIQAIPAFSQNQSEDTAVEQQETSGRVEVIEQRYPDGKLQIQRHVIQDAEGNYRNHGLWQLYNRRGQVLAEGNFNQGSLSGEWQRWHPATNDFGLLSQPIFNQFAGPFLSETTFTNGKLDGIWEIKDRMGRTVLRIPYQAGRRHGTATWYFPSGAKMREIQFEHGQLHGTFIEWNQQNRQVRNVVFREGRQVSNDITYWRPEQIQTRDTYLEPTLTVAGEDDWWNAMPAEYNLVGDRVRHGVSAAWYDNGQPQMRGSYRLGQRHGHFEYWYLNGQKQLDATYVNGQRDAVWTWWHENGMKAARCEFRNDQLVGDVQRWNPDGTVQYIPEDLETIESGFESDPIEELLPPASDDDANLPDSPDSPPAKSDIDE